MRRTALALLLLALTASALALAAPSRPAEKGCAWEQFSGASLEAWVQRCDYGFRKIDFVARKSSLAIRYSDGGQPDPLIDVLVLRSGESAREGITRVFRAGTKPAIAIRCTLVPFTGTEGRDGVERLEA